MSICTHTYNCRIMKKMLQMDVFKRRGQTWWENKALKGWEWGNFRGGAPSPLPQLGVSTLSSGVWGVTGFNTEKRHLLPAVVTGIVIAILMSLTTSDRLLAVWPTSYTVHGRPVNVKHDARCVMGKVGGRQKIQKGEILIYCYKFAVIG